MKSDRISLLQSDRTRVLVISSGARNPDAANRMAAVLVFLLGWVSGAATQESTPLMRADELTQEQRQRWREALEWPTHCGAGIPTWEDDVEHPYLGFLDIGDGRYLAYNHCEYVDHARNTAFNLFLVDTDRPEVKPRLLTLKVLELVHDPDSDPGAAGEERFEARMTALIEGWPLSVDDQGRLVIDRTIDSSGPGVCETSSIYDLDYDPPRLVGLRAQYQCLDNSDVEHWTSYSQEYIDRVPLVPEPTRTSAKTP